MSKKSYNFQCPNTKCNYLLIKAGLGKLDFEEYSKDVIAKMNNGEIKNFIVHCSSYSYSNGTKTLDIFEMVECFGIDIFSITKDIIPETVSFSKGMIFVFPFDDDTKSLINPIFEHENARIITNNMNKTISILNYKNVRFNLNRIIDIQTKFNTIKPEYFEQMDEKTKSYYENNVKTFDKNRFLRNLYFAEDPFSIIFSKPYLQKATFRCNAIGLVFQMLVKKEGIDKLIESTKNINSSFSILKRTGCCG